MKRCIIKGCRRPRRSKKQRLCKVHHAEEARAYRARVRIVVLSSKLEQLKRENQRRRAVQSRVW